MGFDDGGSIPEHAHSHRICFFECPGCEEESGRPVSSKVADVEVAVGLILWDEDAHMGRECLGHAGDIFIPMFLHIGVEEIRVALAFWVVEPVGEGEVPECDNRLDALGAKFLGHVGVLADGGFVKNSRLRLDTPPLDTKPVVVHPKFLQRGEVFVEPTP